MVNQEKNTQGPESSKGEKLEERKSEAISDETVSDLQDTEEDSSPVSPDPGPSPDGALDESDEIKDAGPM